MLVDVEVPCESVEAYRNDEYWRHFNIVCESAGIEDAENNVRVWSTEGRIVAVGVEGREVSVYDMTGQQVGTSGLRSGIYMVCVAGLPARKVVVMR